MSNLLVSHQVERKRERRRERSRDGSRERYEDPERKERRRKKRKKKDVLQESTVFTTYSSGEAVNSMNGRPSGRVNGHISYMGESLVPCHILHSPCDFVVTCFHLSHLVLLLPCKHVLILVSHLQNYTVLKNLFLFDSEGKIVK